MIDVQSFIQKRIPKTKLSKQRTESLVDALLELRLLYIEEHEQKEHYKNLFLNVADENTQLVAKCMELEKSQNNCETKAGRKRKIDQEQFNMLVSEGQSMDQIMEELGISRATYYRMKARNE